MEQRQEFGTVRHENHVGALLGADSPLMARMYSSCEDLSTVPYT